MPCMCGDSQCRSCGSAQGTLDDGPKRYRLRVEEVGQDDPPADLRYVLGLYIDAPTWEDRLEFEITDRGVAELLYELSGQEEEEGELEDSAEADREERRQMREWRNDSGACDA